MSMLLKIQLIALCQISFRLHGGFFKPVTCLRNGKLRGLTEGIITKNWTIE